ncbi:hypothetical protein [Halalkalibacter alkaliphilus]|uniref:Uncharacterized protein n=1 Tax=Halalkalibacter alkaliphilus TaxID=2917993 RepID=A0A9X2A6Q0_9BACI|nr:hypothetical protein [Halalkalibacter alkaliphilus]MCL7746596.1 hypothetical protein [Halalkalibacter alkaliphilus]
MIRRFSGQEIFIILAAVAVLLFMYAAIILSAPTHESIEDKQVYSERQVSNNLITEEYSLMVATIFERTVHE